MMMMTIIIVTRVYRLDGRGSISRRGKRVAFLHSSQTGSGTHPASYPIGTAAISRGRGE
jgi:hypothetical protein